MTLDPTKIDFSKLRLSIDAEGAWRHEGVAITHPRVLAMLYLALAKDGPGYCVHVEGLRIPVEVADCPYVVLAVRHLAAGIQLTLTDGDHALLDPATLTIDAANVPRCVVKPDGGAARFSRTAWVQLAEAIEEGENGAYLLRVGGQLHPLRILK